MAKDSLWNPADPGVPGRKEASYTTTETSPEGSVVKHLPRVVVEDDMLRSFVGVGATFRIPGSAALAQPLWSIENTTGSAVLVGLRRLFVGIAQSAANLTHPPWFYLFRTTTMPTGGTAITKSSPDSRIAFASSAASVAIKQGASADGVISAITAPIVLPRLSSMFGSQLYTAVGHAEPLRLDMLSGISDQALEHGHLILGAGQALVLHVTTAAAADNIATRSFIVDFAWSEFTEIS